MSLPIPTTAGGIGRLVQDLVVDVGDVPDKQNVISAGAEPAAQHIEGHTAAHMSDMGQTLHGCPAQVDGDGPGLQRHEVTHGTHTGVVQPKRNVTGQTSELTAL